jgi:chemotaxis protein histidine kinase CheA
MDEDARRLLELLRPAVERAEQIGQQQQALLQRHEESAQAFAEHIGKIKEAAEKAAETERASLLAEREAAVAQAREETIAIVAAAHAEEEAAHARIAELLQAQAQREAAHAAKLAAAEAEREEGIRQREAEQLERLRLREAERAAAEAEREELIRQREAEQLERLRLREAEHGARMDRLLQQGLESEAERDRAFEAAYAEKQERLQALCRKEGEILARAREMQELVRTDGEDAFVVVSVGGRQFETTIGCLTRFPHSTLAVLWHDHRTSEDKTASPLRVPGDPSLFHLILNHLACPNELPVVSDVAQIQWLERESKRYGLDDLERQCRAAYKRLDTVKAMQLTRDSTPSRSCSSWRPARRTPSCPWTDLGLMKGVKLAGATGWVPADMNMSHAKLGGSDLAVADLKHGNLSEADLKDANLRKADLRSADLTAAELSGARLCGAMLEGARGGRAATVQVQPANGQV